jgi:hypothetical protein
LVRASVVDPVALAIVLAARMEPVRTDREAHLVLAEVPVVVLAVDGEAAVLAGEVLVVAVAAAQVVALEVRAGRAAIVPDNRAVPEIELTSARKAIAGIADSRASTGWSMWFSTILFSMHGRLPSMDRKWPSLLTRRSATASRSAGL